MCFAKHNLDSKEIRLVGSEARSNLTSVFFFIVGSRLARTDWAGPGWVKQPACVNY